MTTQTAARTARRPALLGFAVGFVLTFVVTVLALLFTAVERIEDVLVPAAALLSPLSETMASWNGLAVMVLAGTVNGLVYAVVFAGVAAAVAGVRRRGERR
jgi:hypothetical protein